MNISDAYTRSNETPLAGNYTQVVTTAGTFNLASNQVVISLLANTTTYYWNANTFNADQWAQVDVTTFVTSDSNIFGGVLLRAGTTDRTYYMITGGGAGALGSSISRRIAGANTAIQTDPSTVVTAPFPVYGAIAGSAYEVRINGVVKLSGTDPGGISSGRIGIAGYVQDVSADLALDNFTGGDRVSFPPMRSPVRQLVAMWS